MLKIVAYDSAPMEQLSCHDMEQYSSPRSRFANPALQIVVQDTESSAEQLGFVCLGGKAPP